MGLIKKYANRKLLKKAELVKRKIKIPRPEAVKKVGILWQPSETDAYSYMQNYFMRKQVIVRNMCIDLDTNLKASATNIITSKDLDWKGLPKPESCNIFINAEFDLLLNVALVQNLPLKYITALSRAKFKVGWSPDEHNFFDLNIKIGTKQDSLYLAEQQIFYLSQLNKISSI